MTIITKVITMVALIIEEKLGLLLLKNSGSNSYVTLISKSSVKWVSKQITLRD